MDKNQALSFLKENQPFPSDKEVDIEDIKSLDEVRKYFIENPYPEMYSPFS